MTELSNPQPVAPPRNQWLDVWDQFKTHRGALWGGIIFVIIIAGVYLGPLIWRVDPQFLPQGRDFINLRDMRPIWVGLFDSSAKVSWATATSWPAWPPSASQRDSAQKKLSD